MWFVGNTEVGFTVSKARGLTIGDIQYPRNIFVLWSKEELAAIGIKPYREVRLDSRYYSDGALTRTEVDGEMVGTYAGVAKDVDQLKSSMMESVKSQVSSLQGAVDWYWSRAAKGGTAVPDAIRYHAAAIYTEMEAKETAIDAMTTLDEIIARMEKAHADGQDVARVHSGDPAIYGAIAEQMRRLDSLNISYDITPGVPAFAAAAALLKQELTLPEISQTVIVTRTDGKASPMPKGEDLATIGATGATLAIHLSVRNLAKVVRELSPHYGEDCPVCVVYRASWPDEKVISGTLSDIREKVRSEKITRTALILVGHVLNDKTFSDSKLYHADHRHILRPR